MLAPSWVRGREQLIVLGPQSTTPIRRRVVVVRDVRVAVRRCGPFASIGRTARSLVRRFRHDPPDATMRPTRRGGLGGLCRAATPPTNRPGQADLASGTSDWSLISGCRVVHFFSVSTTCVARRLFALATIG